MHADGPPGPIRGTAGKLRERNAARAGISLAPPEQPINASAPLPEEEDVDGEGEEPDLLDEFAGMPVDQRILALEDYVFHNHTRQLPELSMRMH